MRQNLTFEILNTWVFVKPNSLEKTSKEKCNYVTIPTLRVRLAFKTVLVNVEWMLCVRCILYFVILSPFKAWINPFSLWYLSYIYILIYETFKYLNVLIVFIIELWIFMWELIIFVWELIIMGQNVEFSKPFLWNATTSFIQEGQFLVMIGMKWYCVGLT